MTKVLLSSILFVVFVYGCGGSHENSVSLRIPSCIDSLVKAAKGNQDGNGPQSITKYQYEGQMVYYVVAPCCDQYNTVYDGQCKPLGSPDGGITGKGDGTLQNFFTEASDKTVIWEK